MAPWLIYIKERFSPATYALLILGMTLSARSITAVPALPVGTALGMICLLVFFFTLRLMDEFKDLEKDKVAHPNDRCRAG